MVVHKKLLSGGCFDLRVSKPTDGPLLPELSGADCGSPQSLVPSPVLPISA